MTIIKALRSTLLGAPLAVRSASCAVYTEAPVTPRAADIGAAIATEATAGHIVQSGSAQDAAAAVEAVGGVVTHELGIICAVGATWIPHGCMRSRLNDSRRSGG